MHAELHRSLVDLCALRAPSGVEADLVQVVADRWSLPHERDRVGNLLVKVGGEGPRTLIQAHGDQIGFVVVGVTADGFVRLDSAQGQRAAAPDSRWPVGHPAALETRDGGWVPGVFAAASGHVTSQDRPDERELTWANFWVDLGCESDQEVAAAGVFVGSSVIFAPVTTRYGAHRVAGTSMDDRVGLCVMERLLERVRDRPPSTCELWLGVTVQEENGLHGASAMGHQHSFDRVVGLEVGLVGDVPGVDSELFGGRLGGGPMLVHKDGAMTYDRPLGRLLSDAAVRAGVTLQDAAFTNFSSDGLGFLRSGSPAALVAVPTRYTHTAFEMIDLRDLQATVDLLEAFVG